MGGDLYLKRLTSAEGLILPQRVGGKLRFSGRTFEDRQRLREQRPDLANKIV